MKENWTCRTNFTLLNTDLIIVSNYPNTNEVVNYHFENIGIRQKSIFDIGVWKKKTKK